MRRLPFLLIAGVLACGRGTRQAAVLDSLDREIAALRASTDSSLGLSAWIADSSVDEMDGAKRYFLRRQALPNDTASVLSLSAIMLRCDGKTFEAWVRFDQPLAMEHDGGHRLRLRFDDDSVETQEWSPSESGEGLFAPDPIRFSERIAASDTLRVEFKSLSNGRQIRRFSLAGFSAAVGPVWAPCRVRETIARRRHSDSVRAMQAAAAAAAATRARVAYDSLLRLDLARRAAIEATSRDSTLPWVASRAFLASYYRNVPGCPTSRDISPANRLFLKNDDDAEFLGLIKSHDPRCQ